MNIGTNIFSIPLTSIGTGIKNRLQASNKRMIAIFLLAIGFLAAGSYLICSCLKKRKIGPIEKENKPLIIKNPIQPQEEQPPINLSKPEKGHILDQPSLKPICLESVNDFLKITDFQEDKIKQAVEIFKAAKITGDESIKGLCIAYFKEAFSQSFKNDHSEYYKILPEYHESIDIILEQAKQEYNESFINKEKRKQIIHQLTKLLEHLQDNLANGREEYKESYFKLVGKLFEIKAHKDLQLVDWWDIIEKSPIETLTKLILDDEDSWNLLQNLLAELTDPSRESVHKVVHHFIFETLPTQPNGEQIYLNFLRYLSKQVEKEDGDLRDQFLKIIEDFLSEEKIRELATLISIREDAWDLFPIVLDFVTEDNKLEIYETIRNILKVKLPTIQDGQKLLVFYENCCDDVFIGLLPLAQMEMLIRIWMTKSNNLILKISHFLNGVMNWPEQKNNYLLKEYSPHNLQIIHDLLNFHPEINRENLIIENRAAPNFCFPIQPYLCAIDLLKNLNPEDSNWLAKVGHTLNFIALPQTLEVRRNRINDEQAIFAAILANECSPNQLKMLVLGLSNLERKTQALVLHLLAHVLKSNDREKIRQVFTAYWSCFEELHEEDPHLLWQLIPFINTPEICEAISQAIPQEISEEKKEKIKELLRIAGYRRNL